MQGAKNAKQNQQKKQRKQRYRGDPLRRLIVERVAGARDRAMKKNIFFDISVDDILLIFEKTGWQMYDIWTRHDI